MHRTVIVSLVAALVSMLVSAPVFAAESDLFTSWSQKGPAYAALAALLGGLLTSLTPCVYPMIAVTVSVFGAREARSRAQAVALSTVFVLGIASMFTPLGLAAGLTGSLFGGILSHRWVVVGIAVLFLALAGPMFGVYEFVLPSRITNKLATMGGIGYSGAFVLGLVSGIVAAPCTGPVLTGILLWIGETQSPMLGALALFAFSLGLGVPFWVVGVFAMQLPKSGRWMLAVKSLFGIVMIVAALYYLKNAFPAVLRIVPVHGWVPVLAAGVAVVGIGLGALHVGFDQGRGRALRKGLGIALVAGGAIAGIAWFEMPKGELAWLSTDPVATEQARRESRPMMIDFTAEWCAACKRLARETFADPVIRKEAERFVLLRIDATVDDDPAVVQAQRRYNVAGLPTVILIDSQGQEKRRFTDFVTQGELYEVMVGVR